MLLNLIHQSRFSKTAIGSKIDFVDDKLQIDHPRMHEPKLQGTY